MRVVLGDEMNVAADAGVGQRAADFVHGAFLAGHGLDDFRPADEHVGGALDHDDEVHQGRRIGRAARARAGDDRDLRHHARDEHVAEEDLAVAGERIVAFLDARAAGIVEADDRAADLQRVVHHVADLLGVNAAQRAAADGEVLAEGGHQAAVHEAGAGHDAVARDGFAFHAEVVAIVVGVHAAFLEGAGLEKRVQPVAGGHQALFAAGVQFVLRRRRRRAAARRFSRSSNNSFGMAIN